MTANQHRENARRIRELCRTKKESHSLDHLLPRLAVIHDELADVKEGRVVSGDVLTAGTIDGWADGVCRRLLGVTPRPQVITAWEVWTRKQLAG